MIHCGRLDRPDMPGSVSSLLRNHQRNKSAQPPPAPSHLAPAPRLIVGAPLPVPKLVRLSGPAALQWGHPPALPPAHLGNRPYPPSHHAPDLELPPGLRAPGSLSLVELFREQNPYGGRHPTCKPAGDLPRQTMEVLRRRPREPAGPRHPSPVPCKRGPELWRAEQREVAGHRHRPKREMQQRRLPHLVPRRGRTIRPLPGRTKISRPSCG